MIIEKCVYELLQTYIPNDSTIKSDGYMISLNGLILYIKELRYKIKQMGIPCAQWKSMPGS